MTLQDQTFVKRSVNYAKLFEFNYFEMIFYIVKRFLLKTGIVTWKWGNIVIKWGKH